MSRESLVELRDVVKAYATPGGMFVALRGVDLRVRAGEFVAVIGKSGSGKSTLLNAVAGIDRPTSGEVYVAGTAIHTLDENAVAAWRGANLGVIFQFFQLLPTLTLLENVILPMELARRGSPGRRRNRAMALLERVEMGTHADKLPSQVSGGQQQRVAIARALANDPALIVADEPTGSLDSRTADSIFQLFEELVGQGKTILMVTHDTDLADRASRVVLIADGEVVEAQVRTALTGLSERQLSEVSARLDPMVFGEGDTVFEEGETADRFYIVVRGELEVVRARPGISGVVASLGPGQYFGEIGLLEGTPRNATVRVAAGGDASLLALDAEVFRRLVSENALAHDAIARVMRERMTADTVRRAVPGVDDRLRDLAGRTERLGYAAGEVILRPGDPADRFGVVAGGVVEVTLEGEDHVSFRLEKGHHFGAAGLSRDGKSLATLRASPGEAGGTEILVIPEAVRRDVATAAGLADAHIALLLLDGHRG